jgi:aspartate 1-decarboxylase
MLSLFRTVLKSKIHRATITGADLDYEGSVSIDENLLQLADILPHEQVQLYNISNGNRLTTYAISAPAGSGTICANGAAAHHIQPGDLVIIASYASVPDEVAADHQPCVILVNHDNQPQDQNP